MFITSSSQMLSRKILVTFMPLLICGALSCSSQKSGAGSGNRSTKAITEHAFKGSLKRTLTGHDESVRSVAFSADGKTVASGGLGNVVKLWDAQTGSLKRALEDTEPPVGFSPNGQTLATVDGFKNTISS